MRRQVQPDKPVSMVNAVELNLVYARASSSLEVQGFSQTLKFSNDLRLVINYHPDTILSVSEVERYG
jgi:hypothetical protein